jgi:hypothetical protein
MNILKKFKTYFNPDNDPFFVLDFTDEISQKILFMNRISKDLSDKSKCIISNNFILELKLEQEELNRIMLKFKFYRFILEQRKSDIIKIDKNINGNISKIYISGVI